LIVSEFVVGCAGEDRPESRLVLSSTAVLQSTTYGNAAPTVSVQAVLTPEPDGAFFVTAAVKHPAGAWAVNKVEVTPVVAGQATLGIRFAEPDAVGPGVHDETI